MFGPSHNDLVNLAKSMQVFLLSTLTSEKISINLCSKPVCNVKAEWLKDALLSFFDEVSSNDIKILPIIIDRGLTNNKLLRMLLKEKNNSKCQQIYSYVRTCIRNAFHAC